MKAIEGNGTVRPLPVIAKVTFSIDGLLKLRPYRISDSLGFNDTLGYRSKDETPLRGYVDRIARRKVDRMLENGGVEPRGELAYEDEGVQFCGCTLSTLAVVQEWIERARKEGNYNVWNKAEWVTEFRPDNKTGTLNVMVCISRAKALKMRGEM